MENLLKIVYPFVKGKSCRARRKALKRMKTLDIPHTPLSI